MVALMTALCLWVYRSGQNAAMLQGAVIFCFVLGVGCTLWEAQTRRKRYASMPEAEELEAAAAEVATAHVEQKSDGVEAIYIPITENTMKLRSDDLMVDFDLQPENSEFIWHLIHKTHNTYKFKKNRPYVHDNQGTVNDQLSCRRSIENFRKHYDAMTAHSVWQPGMARALLMFPVAKQLR